MVIDTSALLAVMQNEPERRQYLEAIEAADTRLISTATFVETSMVLEVRYGADALRDLEPTTRAVFATTRQRIALKHNRSRKRISPAGESAFRAGTRTVRNPNCRSDERTCRSDFVAAMSSGVDTILTMTPTGSGPASSRWIGPRSLF